MSRWGKTIQESFRPLELLRAVGLGLLLSQSAEPALENAEGPASLEDLLRGQAIDGLVAVTALGILSFERKGLGTPSSLPGPALVALLGKEVLDRHLQEGAKAPGAGS
jgi:hypothetical protein